MMDQLHERYADVSYWLESVGDLAPRAPLPGDTHADVVIVGAGYTGLWTAHYLLRQAPGLRVVVLEREIAGFGASGRNGGWCSANLNASLPLLTRRFGRDRMRALQLAMYDAVDEVGRQAAEHGIDAEYEKSGELLVARGPHHLPAIHSAHEEFVEAGFGDRYQLLDAAQVDAKVRVARAVAGLFTADCAVVQPGKLVRGLAALVERKGGVIHEQTPVTEFARGRPATVTTPHGKVTADVVVLATEAYTTQFPRLHRRLLPVYSLIVMTEPVPPKLLATINWKQRVCVASPRLTIDYLSRTRDGRIVFGGRGAPYNFGSRISSRTERHAPTHEMLRNSFREWFPSLAGVRFTHAWGGVLGMPRDWIPSITYDRDAGIAMAYGYTGHGVATANLAGRVLADLVTARRTELTDLPLVGHRPRAWEPEPFRWLGVRYIQSGLLRIDADAERTGIAPSGHSLPERLSAH